MPLYPTKSAFFALGAGPCSIPPSQRSCPICLEPLRPFEPNPPTTSLAIEPLQNSTSRTEPTKDHSPIKVPCCKNVFCRNCLDVWLKASNNCPFCRAEFFPRCAVNDKLASMLQEAIEVTVVRVVSEFLIERTRREEAEAEERRAWEEEELWYYNDDSSEDEVEYDRDAYHEDSGFGLVNEDASEGSEGGSSEEAEGGGEVSSDLTTEVVGVIAGTLAGMADNLLREFEGHGGSVGDGDTGSAQGPEEAGPGCVGDGESARAGSSSRG